MKTVIKGFALYSLIVTLVFIAIYCSMIGFKNYKYNHISQEITLISQEKQRDLANRWEQNRFERIHMPSEYYNEKQIDSLKKAKNPFLPENRIYQLKTKLDKTSNTIYGDKAYISKMKCEMYKLFVRDREERNYNDSLVKDKKEKSESEIREMLKSDCQ